MALSKARVRRLKQSFNKGSGRNVTQFAQRRKPKTSKSVRNGYIRAINWFNIIIKKIIRTPRRSTEIEITTQNGDFLITETGLAYIISE